ncbi:MAG: hypothetical protein WAO23_08810 [Dethiobacteria bacterium]
MMEVLVVVKILRSRPLPLDDRKGGAPVVIRLPALVCSISGCGFTPPGA